MGVCQMFKVADPLLVRVISFAELAVFTPCGANAMLVGERLTAVPTPVITTVCGLLEALSVKTMDDFRGPAAVGVNVTWMVQEDPGLRPLPQLLLCAKSPLFDPDLTTLDIVRAVPLAFVSEITWAELAIPTI